MKLIYAANQLDSWASTDLNGLDHQYQLSSGAVHPNNLRFEWT